MNGQRSNAAVTRRMVRIVRRALEQGARVEIDGFGTFLPAHDRSFQFIAQTRPRVFIAYVDEDVRTAKTLYQEMQRQGFRPWLDKN